MKDNPYDPDGIADLKYFYGRDQIINKIMKGMYTTSGKNFSLSGGHRIGKTSLLYKIINDIEKNNESSYVKVIPIYVSFQEIAITEAEEFEKFLVSKTRSIINEKFNEDLDNSLQEWEDLEKILMFLKQKSSNSALWRVIWFFDELDVIQYDNFDSIRDSIYFKVRHLLSESPNRKHISLIVTTLRNEYLIGNKKGSTLSGITDKIFLTNLTEIESIKLINKPLEFEFDDRIVNKIINYSGKNPQIIQYIMRDLCDEFDDYSKVTENEIKDIADNYIEMRGEDIINNISRHSNPGEIFILKEFLDKKVNNITEDDIRKILSSELKDNPQMSVKSMHVGNSLKYLESTGIINKVNGRYILESIIYEKCLKDL